ncbi:MAG TPA: hypothetical protein VHZ09_12985 [Acidobacteriaceae bacterium]|nr:hypothetical protein [Acidobacteriaceae bacterium]
MRAPFDCRASTSIGALDVAWSYPVAKMRLPWQSAWRASFVLWTGKGDPGTGVSEPVLPMR